MKMILLLFMGCLALTIQSCNDGQYEYIGQEVIDGKVSATQEGTTDRFSRRPQIWVQTDKTTKMVEIPFEYHGRWKVGDSCLLIIEKYEKVLK